jgi:hypothetical protein
MLLAAGLVWSYVARIGDDAADETPTGALVLLALGAVLIAARLVRHLVRRR